jgi:putative VirB-like lipoprotein
VPAGFAAAPDGHAAGMDFKRPLVALTLVAALAGCSNTDGGTNTDVDRGTTECGTAEDSGDCAETEDGPGTED